MRGLSPIGLWPRLRYARRVHRGRGAARRAPERVSERDLTRIADLLPALSAEECRRVAERSAGHSRFRREVAAGLAGLPSVLFCSQLHLSPSWSLLFADEASRTVYLPRLGAPAVARRAAELYLRGSGPETQLVDLPAELDDPPSPAAPPHPAGHAFLLAALLETTGRARLVVEPVEPKETIREAVERLVRREPEHNDWPA